MQPGSQNLRCPQCGATNPSEARWCTQCHATFSPPQEQPSPPNTPTLPQGYPSQYYPTPAPGPGPYPPFQPSPSKPEAPGATAALVLGMIGAIGWLACGIPGLVGIGGIILGISARAKIRESAGRLGGEGKATAGIVLGSIGTIAALGVIALIGAVGRVETPEGGGGSRQTPPTALPTPRSARTQDVDNVRWTLGDFTCHVTSAGDRDIGYIPLPPAGPAQYWCVANFGLLNRDPNDRRIDPPALVDTSGQRVTPDQAALFAYRDRSRMDPGELGADYGPVADWKLGGLGKKTGTASGGNLVVAWLRSEGDPEPYAIVAGTLEQGVWAVS